MASAMRIWPGWGFCLWAAGWKGMILAFSTSSVRQAARVCALIKFLAATTWQAASAVITEVPLISARPSL